MSNNLSKPELNEGEIYCGAIINADGTGHHIVLLPDDKDKINWEDAMDWAKEIGGDLPSRVEQSILFDQFKDQFKTEWYWSNTQHASDSDFAWCQHFYYGRQYYWYKTDPIRARAVRRLAI